MRLVEDDEQHWGVVEVVGLVDDQQHEQIRGVDILRLGRYVIAERLDRFEEFVFDLLPLWICEFELIDFFGRRI